MPKVWLRRSRDRTSDVDRKRKGRCRNLEESSGPSMICWVGGGGGGVEGVNVLAES